MKNLSTLPRAQAIHRADRRALLAIAACGSSSTEVKGAKQAHYKGDKMAMFNGMKDAVAAKYKIDKSDEPNLTVQTVGRWYTPEGPLASERSDMRDVPDRSISITMLVVQLLPDGDSYIVQITPAYLRYFAGRPNPDTLAVDDPSLPGFAPGKVDALSVDIHEALKPFEVQSVPAMVPAGAGRQPQPRRRRRCRPRRRAPRSAARVTDRHQDRRADRRRRRARRRGWLSRDPPAALAQPARGWERIGALRERRDRAAVRPGRGGRRGLRATRPRGVHVLVRDGLRPAIALGRDAARAPLPEPPPGLFVTELVAGIIEDGDHGEAGLRARAAAEVEEEAGFVVAADAIVLLGAGMLPSPGSMVEKFYFAAV